ncbi:MAG: 2-iminobutanoate/2-iminopropanoate deaminase [Bradyrhizobium sp.]|jgi:hypothetical protein|nr:2-iminobutanoate/2-iminopropanoate deaminase [Bradyrhizobium sp.]
MAPRTIEARRHKPAGFFVGGSLAFGRRRCKTSMRVETFRRYEAVGCAIHARYFRKNPPARILVNLRAWPGHFDIEIDCVAAVL